jgi:hypothetical protein
VYQPSHPPSPSYEECTERKYNAQDATNDSDLVDETQPTASATRCSCCRYCQRRMYGHRLNCRHSRWSCLLGVSTGTYLHAHHKSALLATTITRAPAIIRGHLLIFVAKFEDEDTAVLYTIIVGVPPGVAPKVVVPATAAVVAG